MWLKKFFQDAKIGTKFNLLLLVVFIIGVGLSGAALSKVLQQRAEYEMSAKANILMETVNSMREYTLEYVHPILKPKLETESVFIPEAIPTYSVRTVFDIFRKKPGYENFFYKDAAPNPTNIVDKADSFETQLVQNFRIQPQTKEVSGFRDLAGGKVFYIARPFAIRRKNCLQCHSAPEAAPKSMIATYGSENGFAWKLNEIVAAQVVYVPAQEVFAEANRSFSVVMGVAIAILAIAIILINLLLKKTVIQRIRNISHTAYKISTGEIDSNFEEASNDEIGTLVKAFNRMKTSYELALKLFNQKRN
jgi:HAMP domain-containing protein